MLLGRFKQRFELLRSWITKSIVGSVDRHRLLVNLKHPSLVISNLEDIRIIVWTDVAGMESTWTGGLLTAASSCSSSVRPCSGTVHMNLALLGHERWRLMELHLARVESFKLVKLVVSRMKAKHVYHCARMPKAVASIVTTSLELELELIGTRFHRHSKSSSTLWMTGPIVSTITPETYCRLVLLL